MTTAQFRIVIVALTVMLVICVGLLVAMAVLKDRMMPQNEVGVVILDGGGSVVVRGESTAVDASGLPVLLDAPAFELINQDGQVVRHTDFTGSPYVAAFMFTNCTTACPMMAGRFAELQRQISDKRIKLVSFTVDPERDTPEVLKEYLSRFRADPGRWWFLTGTKEQMIAVERGFGVRLPRPAADPRNNEPNTQVETDPMALLPHSDQFILVDARGRVRGLYDTKDDNAMARLREDSRRLAELK
ncbi:MAG: SCO family protein [Tepidisphaerales bacterium]